MDERFLREEGLEVFSGNELVLKGALESSAALLTGYPGSPISEFFDSAARIAPLLKKHGILAEMAHNEALAVARLNGSRLAGVRAIAAMKSVGLHVAADGLALGNLSEPCNAGGSLVLVGDDTWIDSTQINNDSRFLSQHLHMPVLEPATFQEIKDWVGVGFELSSISNLYLTYLITTPQADGGGTVWVYPNRYPQVSTLTPINLDTQKINPDHVVLLPPRTWSREATLPQRFQTLLGEVRRRQLNRLIALPAQRAPIGLVASGLTYCYLEHALVELGLSGKIPILKLGMTYPVDPQPVLELAQHVDALYVIEEKRGFVETQIVQILQQAQQSGSAMKPVAVWGKHFPQGKEGFAEQRGLNTSLLAQRLIPLFLDIFKNSPDIDLARLRREQLLLEVASAPQELLPIRTPTFCPGCPHRDSSSVFLQIKKDFKVAEYMRKHHASAPIDLVFHGETGCFTMLMFEPNAELMHNYSGMGLGGGTGAGLDPFITNKQVVFLGDSTFFHSGVLAISDSLKNDQDITYVILDNKTTAMTGHQPTPGTEQNLMGETTFAQSIEKIVQGLTATTTVPVIRTNPAYREEYRALLEETILRPGVKVVIADKECGITYHRRQRKEKKTMLRRQGYLSEETRVNITPEVCEFCLECTRTTGCPGLTVESTLYGPKIATDESACVSDGACLKVQACPAFEEVKISRRSPPPRPTLPSTHDLPVPLACPFDSTWAVYTAGVGGMGAGVVSEILVRAGHQAGYRILFCDKKGLAIRNGGVYGHVLFCKKGGVLSPTIPYGKADLLIGLDLLETTRAVDQRGNARVAHPERTQAVVNTALNLTVRMLIGQDSIEALQQEERLRRAVRSDAYFSVDFAALSERFFGSKLFVNMLVLGAAYQRGMLPLSAEHLETAIQRSVSRDDREANLWAFRLGRKRVVDPTSFDRAVPTRSHHVLLQEKETYLEALYGAKTANGYRALVEETLCAWDADAESALQLVQRLYDLVCYENLAFAQRYADLVLMTAAKDRSDWEYAATRAVLKNAAKVMAIKDEVYVAHLLTSPEKQQRDRIRFGIDPARGDRLEYRHINRPEFVLWGHRFRWNMVTRDWQLRLMRRFKFLRRWLSGWHREEKEFRDWYVLLVERFDADKKSAYDVWVSMLNSPEAVRGYREIRQPAMQEARRQVAQGFTLLSRLEDSPRRRGPHSPRDSSPRPDINVVD